MIKKILVNSWMLNDHYPTDPGTIFILDFNIGDETEYYYYDVLPNLGKHYYSTILKKTMMIIYWIYLI